MKRETKIVLVGIVIALLLVVILAPFASSLPDGLEKVSETEGFANKAVVFSETLMPDYLVPGVGNEKLATIMAGIVGTIIVFTFVYLMARWMSKKGNKNRSANTKKESET